MVSVVTKKIKGKEYLYLVESIRVKHRVIQKTIKYIGRKRPVPKEEFECMKLSYQDKDWLLHDFADELSYQDHHKMKQASDFYKKYLRGLDQLSREKEKEKFLSIFIADSNAIEGSTLTQKETFDYLFNDITPSGHTKKELYMASNMLKAWHYLEKNTQRFPREQDLARLHTFVNREIESDKTLGQYKKVQNYIGDVYTTSHLFTGDKMRRLMKWIRDALRTMNEFEVAFQSHPQFELIHPFVDGNGRVGRLLLNWLLIHKGHSPLAIHSKKRATYIAALVNSQKGKVVAISRFCFKEYLDQYSFV